MGQSGTNWVPDADQVRVAELLLNPEDRRSKREKLDEAGVPKSTFYRWMKDKRYLNYLKEQLDTYTDGELPDIWRALILKCKRGDTAAIKLFMELKGEYVPVQKHELTGKDGGPIETKINLSNLTDKELEQLENLVSKTTADTATD